VNTHTFLGTRRLTFLRGPSPLLSTLHDPIIDYYYYYYFNFLMACSSDDN